MITVLRILNGSDPLVNWSISNSESDKLTRVVNSEFLEVEADRTSKTRQFDELMLFALKQEVGFHSVSNFNPAEAVN